MTGLVKKVVGVLVVVFVVFCLVTRPDEVSQAVRSFVDGLKSVAHFFTSLVG
ncbi:MAG: hypothetical protein LBL55_05090 [Propionibacteriaceae bacterium]|jgi:hypothetical protein|nr:hypothetical protein [Propionibacteriaceae bacterium]